MQITRLFHEKFPYLLQRIEDPPKFLDCAGSLPPGEDYKYLCVIGSRDPSDYGREACKSLIHGLRNYPIVIVSGLAIGIDSIAHEAAMAANLKTISFPGSSLSRSDIYPPSHLYLADKIIKSGNTLLSPFEKGQNGAFWTFPVRNRLMAGASQATLIIEGRQGSGTLLTAEYALQFNRDVLIVPGSIFSDLSYGPHKLHTEGAIPVASSREILIELGFEVGDEHNVETKVVRNILPKSERFICKPRLNLINNTNGYNHNNGNYQNRQAIAPDKRWNNRSIKTIKKIEPTLFSQSMLSTRPLRLVQPEISLSNEESLVIRPLQLSPLSSSELIQKTGLNVSQLNIILSELELKGLIKQEGSIYRILMANF